MHGRPRKPDRPEDAAALAAKAEKLRSLQEQLLHNHHQHIYTKEALEVISKLLEVNPEVYTAWNYRKLAVQSILQSLTESSDIQSLVNGELRIVEVALRRNPKCYGAWHHRKWVLSRKLTETNYDHEFRLLDQLLKADSRNFHGWNYRRFVAAQKNVTEDDQLKFMTDMINANFSNYSAWHNRSVLLSQFLDKKNPDRLPKEKILSEEFELVHQALFTDPDDQSGWFYYLWLLDRTITSNDVLLLSSWPADGSNLIFNPNGRSGVHILGKSSQSGYVLYKDLVPIVLYFSQAVKGVNCSTVTVDSMFNKNEDLVWVPLSATNTGEAHCWVTYLRIPDVKCDKPFSEIVVSLGSHGIVSSSGLSYSNPSVFKFTLELSCIGSEVGQVDLESLFIWEDENSYASISSPCKLDMFDSFKKLEINENEDSSASQWQLETLETEISLFRELLSEMDCKIGKLILARLLMATTKLSGFPPFSSTKIHEVLSLYKDLMALDPAHVRFYKDEHSLALLDQITCDQKSFVKYCWENTNIKASGFHDHVHVRLNNICLSRIGYIFRLLWVKVLDLSHNELKSIEGFEAMQSLSCLNLRGNKFSSFTALVPLKHIKTLEVLDISCNEIGAHPIDTTRYLCTSPLIHLVKNSTLTKHWQNNGEGCNCWDTILLFAQMQLRQLDIGGNAVVTDEFRPLLLELLPSLKWLDGVRV